MTSHIHDVTKSRATPLCGARSGVCVDNDRARCPDCLALWRSPSTDARTALTALITEHSGLTGPRAGRLADKIAAEWPPAQGGTPTVDPAALVEKVTVALAQWGICYGSKADAIDPIARAVIAAVWPDVAAARPVVDREALVEALAATQHAGYRAPRRYAEALADAVLTVVADAADVRRQTAEDIAAAVEAVRDQRWRDRRGYSGYTNAAHLAREVGDRP